MLGTRLSHILRSAERRIKKGRVQKMNLNDKWPPACIAYDSDLVPTADKMAEEGIPNIEEWFRWAEEWSMLLRLLGNLKPTSNVLEIGCGLGRIAFPLRFILDNRGTYVGFDLNVDRINWLNRVYSKRFPNFTFHHSNIFNSFYNPSGVIDGFDFEFPAEESSQDLIYAASIFTHMQPDVLRHYLQQSSRALRPGGRFVFSVFLLDYFDPSRKRPYGFSKRAFDFVHAADPWPIEDFAISNPRNPDEMTAYSESFISEMLEGTDMKFKSVSPGVWSGKHENWLGAQDVICVERS